MSIVQVRLQQLRRFWHFYRKAHTLYDIHSPFVADFVQEVLEDDRIYYAFPSIAARRKALLNDDTHLPITQDYGAGSLISQARQRQVSDLARTAGISPYLGRLLFRLVRWWQPPGMIELGTSLGLSAMYQSAAAPSIPFHTVEGNPATARFAEKQLAQTGLPNVHLHHQSFDSFLTQWFEQHPRLDYLFLDGDHTLEGTLRYLHLCLPHVYDRSVIVLADIHWSEHMERAWQAAQELKGVTLSIDLFEIGLLFFRPENRQPQHFRLVPRQWKPWRLGIMGR